MSTSSDEGEVLSDNDEVVDNDNDNLEEGEVNDNKVVKDELEEGEVEEDRPQSVSVCRFFGKGQCTWGQSCRFLHPGVSDKGLYTMFEPLPRPPPLPLPPPPKQGLLGHAPPNFPVFVAKPGPESAWERGLRHAKELLRTSKTRKESDVDFEEKKMNLSLAQEEIDKENDYFVVRKPMDEKPPLPVEDVEENDEDKLMLLQQKRANKIDPDFVRQRVHHLTTRQAPPRKKLKQSDWEVSGQWGKKSEDDHSDDDKKSSSSSSGGEVMLRKAPPREMELSPPPVVRIAPPKDVDEDDGVGQRQFQRDQRGERARMRYAPVNSRFHTPHHQPHPQPPHFNHNNPNYTPIVNRRFQPPPQHQNQQSRYYRSKFQRRSSSSSSSSSTRRRRSYHRSSSSSSSSSYRRRRSKSTTDDSDSSSSLDTTHIKRRVVDRKSVTPPIRPAEVKEVKPTPKKVKLTLEKRAVVKSENVLDKLGSDVEDWEPLTTPPNTNTTDATSTTKSRREELMKQLRAVEEAIAKKRSRIQ